MFNSIVNFVREVRIKYDFLSYEENCRIEHLRRADVTHSTMQIEVELRSKIDQIQAQAEHLFNLKIIDLKVEVDQLKVIILEKQGILLILTRNYIQELQKLYEQKDALFSQKKDLFSSINAVGDEISDARSRKDLAYESLNYFKRCIESWHAKSDRSPWLFGNGGKELPKHSLFGQSFGDLDSYKCKRDCAYSEVQSCKSEIERLATKKRQLGERIGVLNNTLDETLKKIIKVKSDRSLMHELKKIGHSKSQLQKILEDLGFLLINLKERLNSLEHKKNEFIESEKYRQGVVDLENIIQNIKNKKQLFLNAFDSDEAQDQRTEEHKQIWLRERGLI